MRMINLRIIGSIWMVSSLVPAVKLAIELWSLATHQPTGLATDIEGVGFWISQFLVEASFLLILLTIDQEFSGCPLSTSALWMVKACYERNQTMIPSQIQGILAALPPQPPTACQIRLRALDSVPYTNTSGRGATNRVQ